MGIYYQPPGVFMGGQQPYEERTLLPAQSTPVNNPPLRGPRADYAMAYYWAPDTIIEIELAFLQPPQSDPVPITFPGRNPLWATLVAWLPPPPAPWELPPRQTISGPSVDSPSFATRLWETNLGIILGTWQPPPPVPTQLIPHPLSSFRADNPVFAERLWLTNLETVVGAWQPPPPQPKTTLTKFTTGIPIPTSGPLPPDAHLGLPIILGV